MSIESERFNPAGFVPPWTRHEHLERFAFGERYAHDLVVIDCAYGTGIGTRRFAEAGARRVYAYDISGEAVAATIERCRGLDVIAETADAAKLPLPDASADVFISFETFEHLREPEALFAEAYRLLTPGGRFICSTPNPTSIALATRCIRSLGTSITPRNTTRRSLWQR
jgi:ubiquinone/menaquinone biosynthesis C-methylase UbiE